MGVGEEGILGSECISCEEWLGLYFVTHVGYYNLSMLSQSRLKAVRRASIRCSLLFSIYQCTCEPKKNLSFVKIGMRKKENLKYTKELLFSSHHNCDMIS